MLFNSFHFILFFILVTTIYFSIPYKARWFLLLAASCYFYMVFIPVYILILGFTIVVDYFAGIYLEKFRGKQKKYFLIASLIANIGVLAVFKYYNFLNDNLTWFLNGFSIKNPVPFLSIALPIGLSFHTFQAMAYTIEIYRGNQKAERNFGIYALYVMFYPQLVAGPIERPQNLIHQFYEKHDFDYYRITEGLRLMLWGFFKKVVIADRLAIYVNAVYNNVDQHEGFSLILATIFFSFQIYCDFSGYSDIARGAAKVMGFRLMVNFRQPYFSKSIHEFWKKWHISLSSWFKDYLYISLGGSRVSVPRHYINLLIVFLISGLWHGANWTFVIWGGLHGFYLIFTMLTKKIRLKLAGKIGLMKLNRLNNLILNFIVFISVTFSWIFFRAANFSDAWHVITHCFSGIKDITSISGFLYNVFDAVGYTNYSELLVTSFLLVLFLLMEYLLNNTSFKTRLFKSPSYLSWPVYIILFFAILTFGIFNQTDFIYFQF